MSAAAVPLLDLKRQYESIGKAVNKAVAGVLASQRFILGEEVKAFEEECAAYLGAGAAVGVASGTDALFLAFRALNLGPEDEVLTSPFSFFATAGAVRNAGARLALADIDPLTFNLDPAAAEAACTPRTRALCPVHLFGQPAAAELFAMAARRHLPVVEDACQSMGARLDGGAVGALGDFGAFSFFPSKNLGGAGDGGLITARSPEAAARLRALRHHGQTGVYEHRYVGINSRLDELQAAILRVKLTHLEDWTEARRSNARTLSALFNDSGLNVSEGLRDGADLALPVEAAGGRHVYNQFTVRAARRDDLREHLKRAGIGCAVYYPLPLHLQPCFADLGGRPGQFPHAEAACKEVLSLPVFPELTEGELARVVESVAGFYRGS